MRETVENLRKDNPALDSININSGSREPMAKHDPHAEGRAVDINRINDVKASELAAPKTPEAVRAREAADRMVERAKQDKNVNQILGPTGCWEKKSGRWEEITPNEENPERCARNIKLIEGHRDHFHINVKPR